MENAIAKSFNDFFNRCILLTENVCIKDNETKKFEYITPFLEEVKKYKGCYSHANGITIFVTKGRYSKVYATTDTLACEFLQKAEYKKVSFSIPLEKVSILLPKEANDSWKEIVKTYL